MILGSVRLARTWTHTHRGEVGREERVLASKPPMYSENLSELSYEKVTSLSRVIRTRVIYKLAESSQIRETRDTHRQWHMKPLRFLLQLWISANRTTGAVQRPPSAHSRAHKSPAAARRAIRGTATAAQR